MVASVSTPAGSVANVLVALLANCVVTALKFVAFFMSGSGSMLSEAIHSVADTGNQVLLFVGLKRADRQRDDEFQYGYGGERFIFGMLSAAGIFFVGCGVTVYHGVLGLITPHMPELGPVTFVVLGLSFVIEGGSLLYALIPTLKKSRGTTLWKYLRLKADPATLAVLLEDGAAVLGLAIASVGITLSYLTKNGMWDAIGSVVIGALLGVIAVILVIENRDHLLGKAVPEGVEGKFTEILRNRPSIKSFRDVKTRRLTPEVFQFKAEVVFSEEFLAQKLDAALPHEPATFEGNGRERVLRLLAGAAARSIGEEIDAIEAAIRIEIPEARHIDLEVDRGVVRGAVLVEQRAPAA